MLVPPEFQELLVYKLTPQVYHLKGQQGPNSCAVPGKVSQEFFLDFIFL